MSIKVALAVIFSTINLVSNPIWLIAQNSQHTNSNNYQSSKEESDPGTPEGNQTPGTTRPETSCPETAIPLTALVANNGKDLTFSEYPTFWFYIPYEPEQIHSLNFFILDSRERQTIYKTQLQLTELSGIIKVKIPENPEYALQSNQLYRWRFNLDCNPNKTREPDLVVDGWIKKIDPQRQDSEPLTLEIIQEYQKQEIWQDAITGLAELYFANPQQSELQNAWVNLLRFLDLQQLEQESLVNSEVVDSQ